MHKERESILSITTSLFHWLHSKPCHLFLVRSSTKYSSGGTPEPIFLLFYFSGLHININVTFHFQDHLSNSTIIKWWAHLHHPEKVIGLQSCHWESNVRSMGLYRWPWKQNQNLINERALNARLLHEPEKNTDHSLSLQAWKLVKTSFCWATLIWKVTETK